MSAHGFQSPTFAERSKKNSACFYESLTYFYPLHEACSGVQIATCVPKAIWEAGNCSESRLVQVHSRKSTRKSKTLKTNCACTEDTTQAESTLTAEGTYILYIRSLPSSFPANFPVTAILQYSIESSYNQRIW
jgi:hypothetical protein